MADEMKEPAVLSQQELDRIRELSTTDFGVSAADLIRREREILHAKSLEKAAKFNNTLKKQRERRLASLAEKREQTELARQRVDKEWAELMEKEHQAWLDRADRLNLFRTEAVRKLHSEVIVHNVIKERQMQVEQLQRRREWQRQQQRSTVEVSPFTVAPEKVQQRTQDRRAQAKAVQDFCAQMAEEQRERKAQIERDQKAHGDELAADTKAYHDGLVSKRLNKVANAETYNGDLKQMVDEKARLEAAAKRATATLIDAATAHARHKQEQSERITERRQKDLKDFIAASDQVGEVVRQVNLEVDARKERVVEKRALQSAKVFGKLATKPAFDFKGERRAIASEQRAKIAQRDQEPVLAKLLKEQQRIHVQADVKQFHHEQEVKAQKKRDAAVSTFAFQSQQHKHKQQREAEYRDYHAKYHVQMIEDINKDKHRFEHYATQVIQEWARDDPAQKKPFKRTLQALTLKDATLPPPYQQPNMTSAE